MSMRFSVVLQEEVHIPDDSVVLSFRLREETSLRSVLSFAEATQGYGDSVFRGKIIRPDVYSVSYSPVSVCILKTFTTYTYSTCEPQVLRVSVLLVSGHLCC